jgi:hypothetical protein
MLHEKLGEFDDAIAYYRKSPELADVGMRQVSHRAERFRGLGRCYASLGRRERALWCHLQADSTGGDADRLGSGDLTRMALSQLVPCEGGTTWNVLKPNQALRHLEQSGTAECIAAVLDYLDTEWGLDPSIRASGLSALAGALRKHTHGLPQSTLVTASRLFASDATTAISGIVREAACRGLGAISSDDSIRILRLLLADKDGYVRETAARSLVERGEMTIEEAKRYEYSPTH